MPDAGGVNFSVFSRNATAVELLLFDAHDDREPAQIIKLDPAVNKTFFFWHVYVKGLRPGAHYAYRVDGPTDLHGQGFRYNPNKVLIDPYACGNTTRSGTGPTPAGPNDNLATSMRSVVIDMADYDWEGDRPLNRPMNELIIYEMHVGGFTRHPSSGVKHPGTFAAVDREDPVPEGAGDHRRRIAPGDGVRLQGSAADEARRQRPADATTGATAPSASSPRSRATASRPSKGRTSASFATWSRPCTGPESRSSSTRSSTTPARATTWARRSTSRASATRSPTIWCPPTGSTTWTIPAAATR